MFTNPPIVATGDFVTAALWNDYIRGNGLHLRGLLPDPTGAPQMLVSDSTSGATWVAALTAVLNALGYGPARVAVGSYSGNDVSSGRSISVGFQPRLVVVHSATMDAMYITVSTINSIRLKGGEATQGAAAVHLVSGSTFTVGDGSVQGNVSGQDYTWVAVGG